MTHAHTPFSVMNNIKTSHSHVPAEVKYANKMNTLLLLNIAILSSHVACQSNNGTNNTCCPPPISLFTLASDIIEENIFQGITSDYYLIRAGEVNNILLLPDIGRQLYLRTDIVEFPLILISNEEDVLFNATIVSDDTQVLLNPELLPFSSGVVPVTPERSHVIFECVSTSSTPLQVSVTLDSYSQRTQQRFCRVSFAFGKECDHETSISSGDLEVLTLRDPITDEEVEIPEYNGCNDTTDATPTEAKKDSFEPVKVILSTVLPITMVILIVLIVVLGIWCIWYYNLRQRTKELELAAIGKAYQDMHEFWGSENHLKGHEKEFPTDKLKVLRELGEGAFGVVYEGTAEDIEVEGESTQVAVKQLRDITAVNEFFREVEFMSHLDHPQIVRLLGVCSVTEPYAMIFEYMDLGDLCSFLRDAALIQTEGGETILENEDLLRMSLQVAEGMVYIASKKLVHRDLATRNCLVRTGGLVKIADFGMSRNIYSTDYYRVQGSALLPIRWMAPESIKYGKFSEASDMWSYGVLLWEMFTFGQQPFTGYTNDEVMGIIGSGGSLEPPANSGMAAQVMLDCWEHKSKNRPTFREVCSHLTTIINDLLRTGNERTLSRL